MESIGADYGACKGTAFLTIKWVEKTVKKAPDFKLPGKNILTKEPSSLQYIVVDVTESLINRSKKQKEWYSGKKSAIR
jgi:hypothetical protein